MPITDPRIAGGVALVGVILEIIALSVNNISGYSVAEGSLTCRWSSVSACAAGKCVNIDYSTACDNYNLHGNGSLDGDWCLTQQTGQVWLAFLIIALVASAAGATVIIVRKPKNIKSYRNVTALFLFSFVGCAMTLGEWFILNSANGVCYDTDADGTYFGGSAFLVIFAGVVYLAAYILSCMAEPVQDGQTNYSAMAN